MTNVESSFSMAHAAARRRDQARRTERHTPWTLLIHLAPYKLSPLLWGYITIRKRRKDEEIYLLYIDLKSFILNIF